MGNDHMRGDSAGNGLSSQINVYCERTSFDFWAEPINALSNISFFFAAGVVLLVARRAGRYPPSVLLLVALIFSIGTGSFLFHTFATRWAGYADVAPILMFIVTYLAIALRFFFALRWPIVIAIGLVFVPAAIGLAGALREISGGALGASAGYVPAALAMGTCGTILALRRHAAGLPLLFATGLFLVSITLRSFDGPLCPAWPVGTHFTWHVLNGILLAWLVILVVRHGSGKRSLTER